MSEQTPDKIEVNVPKGPREKPVEMSVAIKKGDDSLAFSKDTVFYLLYLLYKSNMISRVNLRQIIGIIDQKLPDNVAKWLVEEAAKA